MRRRLRAIRRDEVAVRPGEMDEMMDQLIRNTQQDRQQDERRAATRRLGNTRRQGSFPPAYS